MQIFYHHLSKSIESGVEYEVEQDQPQQMVWPSKEYTVMFLVIFSCFLKKMLFDCGDCKGLSILCVLTNVEKDDDVQSKFEKPLRGVARVH